MQLKSQKWEEGENVFEETGVKISPNLMEIIHPLIQEAQCLSQLRPL